MGRLKGVFDKVKSGGLEAVQKRFEAGRRLAGSSGEDDKAEKDNNSAFAFYGGVMMPKPRAALCARKPPSK